MKLNILILGLSLLLMPLSQAGAQEFQKAMMTGGPTGTYIQIGQDIARLSADCGYTLNVVPSAGSLENLISVKKRVNTQFGIVQSDVLDYVRTYSEEDADLRRSLYGVRIMFPLYNEEVQVLAKKNIKRLADLAGKKVAIGSIDSGTYLTATLILDILKVPGVERLQLTASSALPKLQSGEIDAIFYVSGAPTKLFANTSIDGSKYHLVEIVEPALRATYTEAKIPAGTYPFQKEDVNLVAVKAVLMTYDFKPEKNQYHKDSCKAVSDTANIVLSGMNELRSTGHPKWQTVDLAALPPGWKVGNCVKSGMKRDYKLSCKPISTAKANFNRVPEIDEEYLKLLKLKLKK